MHFHFYEKILKPHLFGKILKVQPPSHFPSFHFSLPLHFFADINIILSFLNLFFFFFFIFLPIHIFCCCNQLLNLLLNSLFFIFPLLSFYLLIQFCGHKSLSFDYFTLALINRKYGWTKERR